MALPARKIELPETWGEIDCAPQGSMRTFSMPSRRFTASARVSAASCVLCKVRKREICIQGKKEAFHMNEMDADYLCRAVAFVAQQKHLDTGGRSRVTAGARRTCYENNQGCTNVIMWFGVRRVQSFGSEIISDLDSKNCKTIPRMNTGRERFQFKFEPC